MTLFALRPRARIELGPVVPAFLRWKRGEVTTARAWVESLFLTHTFSHKKAQKSQKEVFMDTLCCSSIIGVWCLFEAKPVALIALPERKRSRRALGRSRRTVPRRFQSVCSQRRALRARAADRLSVIELFPSRSRSYNDPSPFPRSRAARVRSDGLMKLHPKPSTSES